MDARPAEPLDNLPELSVSEVSARVKRTVETAFGRVRVRGEISRPSRAASGHVYLTLKDDKAVLDAVCWRGTAARLAVRPEEGMEVVCVGRITTYPGRSKYQLVVESMEPAGEGALLKMLEDRRRRLAAEGLFDEARKRPLPFLPDIIGVVTSPTGAALRDILRRLEDRFPVHVLVWPVLVQGEGAKGQVAAAIEGFGALPPGGAVPRPDLVIVARGGGSLEDLWAFNEEEVARAAAASPVPLISAIGHETDTTLIDFAADRRAPTPTAAAEMAVPARAELLARVADREARLLNAIGRLLGEAGARLEGLARGLGDPGAPVEARAQALDWLDGRLDAAAARDLDRRSLALARMSDRLPRPEARVARAAGALAVLDQRLRAAGERRLERGRAALGRAAARLGPAPLERSVRQAGLDLGRAGGGLEAGIGRALAGAAARLEAAGRLLEAGSFERVLERGFALVRDGAGAPVRSAAETRPGQAVALRFRDGEAAATIGPRPARARPRPPRPPRPAPAGQDSLF